MVTLCLFLVSHGNRLNDLIQKWYFDLSLTPLAKVKRSTFTSDISTESKTHEKGRLGKSLGGSITLGRRESTYFNF